MNGDCFNCGEPSHMSRDCRATRRGTYGQPAQGQARLNAIFPGEAGFNEVEQ